MENPKASDMVSYVCKDFVNFMLQDIEVILDRPNESKRLKRRMIFRRCKHFAELVWKTYLDWNKHYNH